MGSRSPHLVAQLEGPGAIALRSATTSDTPALISLAVATGLFQREEAEALLGGVLGELHAGRLDARHVVHVAVDDADVPSGWVYASADGSADGVWELWWK